jgi:hypothetical protein
MTSTFQSFGFSIAARHRYSDVGQALKELDNATLHTVIAYQARVDTRNAVHLRRHLQVKNLDESWRARVFADIDAGRLDRYFLISHPAVLIGQLCIPLLKKDRQEIYQLQRKELIAGGYDRGLIPCIQEELRKWD